MKRVRPASTATVASPQQPHADGDSVSSENGAAVTDVVPVCPASPASNRDRFRAAQMPHQITCDLSMISVEPGLRFTFQGIVLVVFPSSSNPLRRHVLIGDGRGSVGITVWNAHVNSFSAESVGQLLVVTKVSVAVHNGTRGIALNKESTVHFNTLADHFASTWWQGIPHQPAVSAILFCEQKDNAVVNVAGIVPFETSSTRARKSLIVTLATLPATSTNEQIKTVIHTIRSPLLDTVAIGIKVPAMTPWTRACHQ